MSNFYEALLNADRDLHPSEQLDAPRVAVPERSSTFPKAAMEQEMIELYRQIDALLPGTQEKVLQFVGLRSGSGVSIIAREYAAMAVTRLGKSVLLLDTDQISQQNFFGIREISKWDETVGAPEGMEKAFSRIGESALYVGGLSHRTGASPFLFEPCKLKQLFMQMKKRFDIVLIDSTHEANSASTMILSSCADGVLLIVEADRTRWPVVENLKTRIQGSGGNILGMIFNKRRYYIPEFLYRRL